MTEERDYEALASEQGWTPKEGWKGDPDKWVDAETFYDRGEQIAGILKSKNAKLEDRLNRVEQSSKQLGDHFKKTIEAQRKKSAETIQELEAKVAQAVNDSDGDSYQRLNREIGMVLERERFAGLTLERRCVQSRPKRTYR